MMLALYQNLPTAGAKPQNIAAMDRATSAAAAAGAGLITFPELYLTGYNIGRTSLHALAEAIDGPAVAAVAAIAKRHRIGIVFGMPERDGSRVFNTAVAVDRTGELAGSYRKIHLYGEEERRTFAPGDSVCVAALCGRRVGLAICYDIEFPEMARALVAAGADLICVPTANMLPYTNVATILVPARALENAVWIVYANLSGTEGGLTYTGQSCIVGPDGREAGRAGPAGVALLCCSAETHAAHGSIPRSTQHDDLRAEILMPSSSR